MKMNYSYNEMKRAFECGRNFQLTAENNFQEFIEELNQVNKISSNPMLEDSSFCVVCGKKYKNPNKDSDTCYDCREPHAK